MQVPTDNQVLVIGEQIFVAVHAGTVPAGERSHHRLYSGFQRAEITGAVDIAHLLLIALGWPAVHTIQRATIADKMLSGGDNMFIG